MTPPLLDGPNTAIAGSQQKETHLRAQARGITRGKERKSVYADSSSTVASISHIAIKAPIHATNSLLADAAHRTVIK